MKKINTNEVSRANSIRFAATIKAAEADDDFDEDKLPTEFAQAKELWEANDPKCLELLLGFIKCFFFKEYYPKFTTSGFCFCSFVLPQNERTKEKVGVVSKLLHPTLYKICKFFP